MVVSRGLPITLPRTPLPFSRDRGAAETECLHGLLKLLGRKVGMLQRHGGERGEPAGMRRAELRELFVLCRDQLAREIAIGAVPERIDAEDLEVDPLPIHRFEPPWTHQQRAVRRRRLTEHLPDTGHHAVGVEVHRPGAAPAAAFSTIADGPQPPPRAPSYRRAAAMACSRCLLASSSALRDPSGLGPVYSTM